jgi:hypothetical protein
MAEGRGRAEWGRMASLMSLVANVNRDPRRRRQPFTPDDFNPYHERRQKPAVVKADFGVLKMIFCKNQPALPARRDSRGSKRRTAPDENFPADAVVRVGGRLPCGTGGLLPPGP